MRDLVYRAQHAEKTAAARQRRRLVCRNCGRLFTRHADWHGTRTCGKACEQELRRRNALASQPTLRPEDAGYRSLAARLEALEPAAFGALHERDRAMVRLFCGPGGRRGLHVR